MCGTQERESRAFVELLSKMIGVSIVPARCALLWRRTGAGFRPSVAGQRLFCRKFAGKRCRDPRGRFSGEGAQSLR